MKAANFLYCSGTTLDKYVKPWIASLTNNVIAAEITARIVKIAVITENQRGIFVFFRKKLTSGLIIKEMKNPIINGMINFPIKYIAKIPVISSTMTMRKRNMI